MTDLMTRLRSLRRPALLTRAVRHGVDHYRRAVHLPRALGSDEMPRGAAACARLLEIEEEWEARRHARSDDYSAARHVEVLIALAGEARLLMQTAPAVVAEARSTPAAA